MKQLLKHISLFAFLGIALLFTSCNNEPSAEGFWKLSYEIKDGEKVPLGYSSRILDFTQDSLKIIIFDMNTGTGYAKVDTLNVKYLRTGDRFTFHNKKEGDLEMNVIVSKDSLIWSAVDTALSTSKYVFKKLIPTVSEKITPDFFMGKSFTIDNDSYHDSIYFMQNNLALQTGEYGFNSPVIGWDMVSYKEFDFLMLNTFFGGLKRLNISESGEFILGDSPKSKNALVMREASKGFDKEELVGEWIEMFAHSNLPQIPEPDFGEHNSDVTLKINHDSIHINYRNTNSTKAWDLTADGKRIYFNNQLTRNGELWWFQNGSWKIINRTDSSLILHVYTGPMEGMGGDTVVLKRLNMPI